MKRLIAPVMSLAALALPAAAETENPEICAALAGKPGIYLVRSSSDIKPLAAASQEKLQRDIRVYVIPKGSRGAEEQVVHLRVTSKAARSGDNRADSVRLKRNSVASACRQSLFRRGKRAFDNDDDRNDSAVSEYNDFAENVSRANRALNEWHFRWDAGETRRDCQYTADHAAPIEGFGKRKPGKPLVRIASIDEPVADERRPEIASITSVLVHQPNKAQSCFAFRLFQNRDAKWLPTVTRIEAWSFGATRDDRDRRVFTLRWMP
jgi:hypothetical protein